MRRRGPLAAVPSPSPSPSAPAPAGAGDTDLRALVAQQAAKIDSLFGKVSQLLNTISGGATLNTSDPTAGAWGAAAKANGSPQDKAGDYRRIVERVREVVPGVAAPGSTIVVVSKGDPALVGFEGRRGWHFPQGEGGVYAGHYPADSADAVRQLTALRQRGATHLVLPKTAFWWLDHYGGLRDHLAQRGELIFEDPETCRVYWLGAEADAELIRPPRVPGVRRGVRMTESPRLPAFEQSGSRFASEVASPAAPGEQPEPVGVRLIAFFLPQFHPIPENDRAWGAGFTEWSNVVRAQPAFSGHYQPRLPGALGFYDLRNPETREAQARLAAAHGVHGFCYYHYWFHGKRLLERPFEEVLRGGKPDFPFCLCWANEPWSRRWDGGNRDLIQPQSYSRADDRAHARALLPALSDPRAIRIEGRPVFLVYRAKDLPEPKRTSEVWRREVDRAGLPGVYLIAIETSWDTNWDATRNGFDAKLIFQPQWGNLATVPGIPVPEKPDVRAYEYDRAWPELARLPGPAPYRRYPTVVPSWDNSARAGERAVLLHGATPASYGRWLRHAIDSVSGEPPDHRVVFINAWNEWAEGAYLEPDARYGTAFLQETRRVLASLSAGSRTSPVRGGETTELTSGWSGFGGHSAPGAAPHVASGAASDLPFDAKYYCTTYPETILSCRDPLNHYLTEGWKQGLKPNPKFDPAFYRATYPDVAAAGVEPLTHFVNTGLREGRVGSPEDVCVEPFAAEYRVPRGTLRAAPAIDGTIRAIAFYLPQFHAIPENDRWWGKGFTEWTNVRRGRPQFRGHYQPHVPGESGYYNLREPDAVERQAELAREHGIHGFCFYHYWFAGKILLDLPLRRMLAARKGGFPFCLCWANENWTRRWDGRESEVLIAQQHSAEGDLAFIRNIEPALRHRNYIRVGGRPLLLVYRPALLPDPRGTTARWRDYLRGRGLGEVFLAITRTFFDDTPAAEYGFDAAVQFPPHAKTTPITTLVEGRRASFRGTVYDYEQTKRAYLRELLGPRSGAGLLPGVMPSWDNTARRLGDASIWVNASPESYCDWLETTAAFLRQRRQPEERLVFINAWNEWAEGCHLEPDRKFGRSWLNATRLALRAPRGTDAVSASAAPAVARAAAAAQANGEAVEVAGAALGPLRVAFVSHDAHPHGAQYCLLTLASWLKQAGLVEPRFLLAGPGRLAADFSRVGPVLALDRVLEGDGQGGGAPDAEAVRVLRSFCGPKLDAVYVNSAAAGHVCRLTRELGVPHVAHVHELEDSIRRWAGSAAIRLLRDSAAVVIAASEAVAANLRARHRIARDRLKVVYECIKCTGVRAVTAAEKGDLRRWLGLRSEGRLFLGCGTTDARKGPDLFADVAARVRKGSRDPIQFVWIGAETRPGERDALRARAAEHHVADVVEFRDAVATPLPYMLAADVFVLPSREDPFPLVCLEAADCGLPIVCFRRAGGMPDFVGADCGATVPHLDVARMAGRLLWLTATDARLRAHGERARAKVRAEFDVSVKGREIFGAILAAMSPGARAAAPLRTRASASHRALAEVGG